MPTSTLITTGLAPFYAELFHIHSHFCHRVQNIEMMHLLKLRSNIVSASGRTRQNNEINQNIYQSELEPSAIRE